jgi:hypothetical protein
VGIYTNLFVTFLIGGIWHGASWMFVIWGAMHGCALVVHRIWRTLGGNLPKPLAWFVTFLFVHLAWVFFRAENMTVALNILKSMFDVSRLSLEIDSISTEKLAWLGSNVNWLSQFLPNGLVTNVAPTLLILLSSFIISKDNAVQMSTQPMSKRKICYASALFSCSVFMMISSSSSVFLYFNF